ncbi:uncharacterized protein LOC143488624 [Brachyhypopomus gauderio]|uniref:uncharacterized protein LOC143488624 n=1 Tax=Brachyhypopomus gauderio TaxID=698409 RepID=UPI004041B910
MVGSFEFCSAEMTPKPPEKEFEGEESEEESPPPSVYSAPTEYYGEGEEEVSPPPSLYSAPTEYYREEASPPPSECSNPPAHREEEASPPPSEYSGYSPPPSGYSEGGSYTEEEVEVSPPASESSGRTVREKGVWKESGYPSHSEGSEMDSRCCTPEEPMVWSLGGSEEGMETEEPSPVARPEESPPCGGEVPLSGARRPESERRQAYPTAHTPRAREETSRTPTERIAGASASCAAPGRGFAAGAQGKPPAEGGHLPDAGLKAPGPPIGVGSGHSVLLAPRDG